MNFEAQKAIICLDSISSLEDQEDLQKLDDALQQLFTSGRAELGIDAVLRIFERFQDQVDLNIFWNMVHGLETLPNYEEKLFESVTRQPSEFSLLMINRILNAGIAEIQGVNLLDILKGVATDESQSDHIRERAQDFIEYQEIKKQKG
jgi:hypothetical protein